MYSDALIVFLKNPQPGRVKTRLSPPLTPEQACALYRNFVLDALAQYARHLPATKVYVFFAPHDAGKEVRHLVQESLPKIADDIQFFAQSGEDLGQRMLSAFRRLLDQGHRRVVIIGTDHPSLPAACLIEGFSRLDDNDITVGPSLDGGYYLLGLKEVHGEYFRNIRWSTPEVLPSTLAAAHRLNKTVHRLPEWYDVDDIADLKRLLKDFGEKRTKKEAPRTYRCVKALSKELHQIFR